MRKVLVLLFVVALIGTACTRDEEEPAQGSAEQTDLTFYSVTHGPPGDPFWAVYRQGIEDAAEQFGVTVEDLAPEQFSVEEVVNQLDSAIAAEPDGLIVTITDARALEGPLRRAIDQGIPVIAINVPDFRPEGERIPYLFYVGGDEELGGRVTAERLLEERTPKRAVCAIHDVGHVGLEARCKGFTDVMKQQGVEVDKLPIGEDPTQASEQLGNYFESQPDTDALFTLGPVGMTPAIKVLNDEGLADKVIHATFDFTSEGVEAIQDGNIISTVDQQQYLQGYLPVMYLKEYVLHSFLPADDVLTGPYIVDDSNVEEVEATVEQGLR
ncbi:MAG: sugar ABC transporter substrate-binding protein [Actinomycetota bacterium]|nr:sugar ABC transporter substrate-binding protein [Actinomycetota bacterium]